MTKYTPQRLLEMMNRVSGMPLTEVDWEGEFSDVSKECISTEELKTYFNKILLNYNLPPSKRTKASLLVHNKALPFDQDLLFLDRPDLPWLARRDGLGQRHDQCPSRRKALVRLGLRARAQTSGLRHVLVRLGVLAGQVRECCRQ